MQEDHPNYFEKDNFWIFSVIEDETLSRAEKEKAIKDKFGKDVAEGMMYFFYQNQVMPPILGLASIFRHKSHIDSNDDAQIKNQIVQHTRDQTNELPPTDKIVVMCKRLSSIYKSTSIGLKNIYTKTYNVEVNADFGDKHLHDIFRNAKLSADTPMIQYISPQHQVTIRTLRDFKHPSYDQNVNGIAILVSSGKKYTYCFLDGSTRKLTVQNLVSHSEIVRIISGCLAIELSDPVQTKHNVTYVVPELDLRKTIFHRLVLHDPVISQYTYIDERQKIFCHKNNFSIMLKDPGTGEKCGSFSYSAGTQNTLKIKYKLGNKWVLGIVPVFLDMYLQKSTDVIRYYTSHFPNYQVETGEALSAGVITTDVTRETDVLDLMRRFITVGQKYSSTCQKGRRPIIITEDELAEWKAEVNPLFSEENIDEERETMELGDNGVYVVCPTNSHPYLQTQTDPAGIKSPCCAKTSGRSQSSSRGSVKTKAPKVKKATYDIIFGGYRTSDLSLVPGSNEDSLITACIIATTGNQNTENMFADNENPYEDILAKVNAEVASQESYGETPDEISDSFVQYPIYEKHYRIFEENYRHHIFVIENDKIVVPRYAKFYALNEEPRYPNCLIFQRDEDEATYSPIGMGDGNPQMIFPENVTRRLYSLMYGKIVTIEPNKRAHYGIHSQDIMKIFGNEPVSQCIDRYGKLRAVNMREFSVVVPPSQPLNLPTGDIVVPSASSVYLRKFTDKYKESCIDEPDRYWLPMLGIKKCMYIPKQQIVASIVRGQTMRDAIDEERERLSAMCLMTIVNHAWKLKKYPEFTRWWDDVAVKNGETEFLFVPFIQRFEIVDDQEYDVFIDNMIKQYPVCFDSRKRFKLSDRTFEAIKNHFRYSHQKTNYLFEDTRYIDLNDGEDIFFTGLKSHKMWIESEPTRHVILNDDLYAISYEMGTNDTRKAIGMHHIWKEEGYLDPSAVWTKDEIPKINKLYSVKDEENDANVTFSESGPFKAGKTIILDGTKIILPLNRFSGK